MPAAVSSRLVAFPAGVAWLLLGALLIVSVGCGGGTDSGSSGSVSKGPKVLKLPMRTDGPRSLDPVQGSTTYDNRACGQIYDTLLQYKYLKREDLELEPLLLSEMPKRTVNADGTATYRFKLKSGVRFSDDPCFPGGEGRELVSADVFYSWKRMADQSNKPKSWWLYENTIVGFDDYRNEQNAAETFDYDAPVAGFKVIDDRQFEVTLTEPVVRFLWLLAMFQTSVVPREAVEKYGARFARHPVGTGPFLLEKEEDWVPGASLVLNRNPGYREELYPSEHDPDLAQYAKPAGTRLPIVDRVEFTMFVQEQPMWLDFLSGKLGYTQVPDEYWGQAFQPISRKLLPELAKKGIVAHHVLLLDFIFRGFNMEDELVGGYTDKKKWLRQAICLALDWNEQNETFYHGENSVYDGPIPPGLDGFPPGGQGPVSYRGPKLQESRALLAKAGYPGGSGLPEIGYYSSRGGNIPEQVEMTQRQLAKIGVKLKPRLVDFSTLIEAITNKKAPMFSFAWGSDYPDAENNLAMFYGPNGSPGSNHFNYKRDEYDQLYMKIRSMEPSEERTKIYARMRDMVIEDCAFSGSMGRTRNYVINPWLKNFKPTEDFYNWIKYLDLDPSAK